MTNRLISSITSSRTQLFLCISLVFCFSNPANAGVLSNAFEQAKKADAQFRAALAEREANNIAAQAAGAAYYPQFSANYSQLDFEGNPRQTYSISQPLVSADKYATMQEKEPRQIVAAITFVQKEQDLGQRIVKAVSELLKTSEGLRLNTAKITALETQAKSAKRSYELGQGTVTDVRDAQVRLDQARAETLSLQAQNAAAQRQLTSITGMPATPLLQEIPRRPRIFTIAKLDDYLDKGRDNPALLIAQQNQKIADLAVSRANGAVLPTVSAVVTHSVSNNISNNFTGFTMSLPLQANSFFQMRSAATNALKAQEQTSEADLKMKLEIQRLWSLVEAGQNEINFRLSAISSAELSVEATEKSYQGGVRSQIDVLNSIQTLFQVQQEYVTSLLTLVDNYFNLMLQAAVPTQEAVNLIEGVLYH